MDYDEYEEYDNYDQMEDSSESTDESGADSLSHDEQFEDFDDREERNEYLRAIGENEKDALKGASEIETGLVNMGGRYIDPIDKYTGVIMAGLIQLKLDEDRRASAIKIIRNYSTNEARKFEIQFLNVDALCLAILYNSIHPKGDVDNKTFTNFVSQRKSHNPLDIFRYVVLWRNIVSTI